MSEQILCTPPISHSIVEPDRSVPSPLSCLQISIEPLAIKLRTDNKVRGIQRGSQEQKVSLYANDLLLYVTDPISSLPHALTIFQNFGSISGYKLNIHKSELLAINSKAREISFKAFQFIVKMDHLTYLGIKITHLY